MSFHRLVWSHDISFRMTKLYLAMSNVGVGAKQNNSFQSDHSFMFVVKQQP